MTKEKLQELIVLCDQAMEHSRQCFSGKIYIESWDRPKPLIIKARMEAARDSYNEIQRVRMILQEELVRL